jgi:hypothetical protein
VALAAVVLLVGLVSAVYSTVRSTSTDSASTSTAPNAAPVKRVPLSRDGIAAEPMMQVAPADARPTAPSLAEPAVLVVPPARRAGPAAVPTGFPQTPAGAVAQLAAIESTVLQAMSVPLAREVHRQWTLPGAAETASWEPLRNVQAFLGAAGMGQTLDVAATVSASPAAAQVKGADGPAWVVACVLLEVRATITAESRMGYGYCERMQWHHGRWMVAPGTPPAQAPSTWPGSDLSLKAGWRTWVDAGQE